MDVDREAGVLYLTVWKFGLVITLTGVCLLLALACSPGSVQAGGRSACDEFTRTANSLSQGLLTPIQFRDKIKTVQNRGSAAEPAIRDASARLLSTMTQGDGSGFSKATGDMFSACAYAAYYPNGNSENS